MAINGIYIDKVPDSLRQSRNWVVWKTIERNGHPTKIPYQANGQEAKSNDASTWIDFDSAFSRYQKGGFEGIGFVFAPGCGLVGIDLDGCRDPSTGTVADWAREIITKIDSYSEVSPSGTGVKIFCRGKYPFDDERGKKRSIEAPQLGDKAPGIELYCVRRYFAVTGHRVAGVSHNIEDRSDSLRWLAGKYFRKKTAGQYIQRASSHLTDSNVIERARRYLEKIPPAISGQGGHNATYHAACVLILGFALSEAEAFGLLCEWNQACQPPWDDRELLKKLRDAANEDGPRGHLRDTPAPTQSNGKPHRDEHEAPDSQECGEGVSEDVKPQQKSKRRKRGDGNESIVKRLADAICDGEYFARDAGGKLYRFSGGVYRARADLYIRQQVKRLSVAWSITHDWRRSLAEDVLEWISLDAVELWERPPTDRINLLNGVLQVKSKRLEPHDPDLLTTVQLPVAYDPAATCPEIDKAVARWFNDDAQSLAFELAGWLMVADTSIQKAVLLHGEGGNGKSTFLAMLTAFLGKQNTTAKSLQKLESDKFAMAQLVGKLACICADLPSEHLAQTSNFKAITGCDSVSGEYKHRDSFDFTPFCRLVFSANEYPRSDDSSDGFFRRWLVIPFERRFDGTAEDVPQNELLRRLTSPGELSGLLNKALVAYAKVKEQGGLSQPESVRQAWEDFHGVTDPLAVWLERSTVSDPTAFVPCDSLIQAYNQHLTENGKSNISSKRFGASVRRHKKTVERAQKTVSGKLQWVYVGIGLRSGQPASSHD